jgi:hypothetical protein
MGAVRFRGCCTREVPGEAMKGVDPQAFEFALSKINDGLVFERFGLDFLAKVLGYNFIPAGGLQDRGIDGLEHTFNRDGLARTIYQLSIERSHRAKVRDTLDKLRANKIQHDRLVFVTNGRVEKKDALVDDMFERYKIPVTIYDADWFKVHVNDSEQTVSAYSVFVDSYLHEFAKPGKSYAVANLEGDPRLFVFLRHQVWDDYRPGTPVEELLADALILFALEGTDPDKGILRSREEILAEIAKHVKFDPSTLYPMIDQRLAHLSKKPRRINHHRQENKYCLPYQTRLEIQNRALRDLALYEVFKASTEEKLRHYMPEQAMDGADCYPLVEAVLHQVFCQQGLEFAEFVLHGEAAQAVEKSLPDITAQIVDNSSVPRSHVAQVKSSLLMAIREIVYNGTSSQAEFLTRLSRTYMMLFLLQCDPRLATYFRSMASKLRIYVCTSILIPALSEYYLDEKNKRYGNLLRGVRNAGANLLVNDTIIAELAAHFRMIRARFDGAYAGRESVYSEEPEILYVPEMMIRAYFYSRLRGNVSSFDEFLSAFVSPAMTQAEQQLIDWLAAEYGIEYVSDASLGVRISPGDEAALAQAIAEHKSALRKAQTDARLVLTVYALREMRNEAGAGGIFGYQTWWLSTDTSTDKAVKKVFPDRYQTSCCIRADFLYHYVSLAPSKTAADDAFKEMFPTLVGVSISYHLPAEAANVAHRFVKSHSTTNPARLRAILRELSDRIKTEPTRANRVYVKHFLDEEREKLAATHTAS